jgi:hypothetical protein
MSMERSRNDSSREDTVSQVRQRVSEVRVPSKSRCTRVPYCCEISECAVRVGGLFEIKVGTEDDTDAGRVGE